MSASSKFLFLISFFNPEELHAELDFMIVTTWPDGIILLIRNRVRQGLIRARMVGVRAATAQVLVMMDAHIEVGTQW